MACEPRTTSAENFVVAAWRAVTEQSDVTWRSSVVSRIVSSIVQTYRGVVLRYGDAADRETSCHEMVRYDFAVYENGDDKAAVRTLLRDLNDCPTFIRCGRRKLQGTELESASQADVESFWHFYSIVDVRTGVRTDAEIDALMRSMFAFIATALPLPATMHAGLTHALPLHAPGTSEPARILHAVLTSHARRKYLVNARLRESRLEVQFMRPQAATRPSTVKSRRRVIFHFCRYMLISGLGRRCRTSTILDCTGRHGIVQLSFKLPDSDFRAAAVRLAAMLHKERTHGC